MQGILNNSHQMENWEELMLLSLSEVIAGPYPNKLAIALYKSRNQKEILSLQLLQQLQGFVMGSKSEEWGEVLIRVMKNDYQQAFVFLPSNEWITEYLIIAGFEEPCLISYQQKQELWKMVLSFIVNSSVINLTKMNSIELFFKYLERKNDPFLKEMYVDLSKFGQNLFPLVEFMDFRKNELFTKNNEEINKIHYSSIRLSLDLLRALVKIYETSVRGNWVDEFIRALGPFQSQGNNLENILWHIYNFTVCELSQLKVLFSEKPSQKVIESWTNLHKILQPLCLLPISLEQHPQTECLVSFFLEVEVLGLDFYLSPDEHLLYISEEVFHLEFSDTLAGCHLLSLLSTLKNIPMFFNKWFQGLKNIYNKINWTQTFSNNENRKWRKNVIEFLIKLALCADKELKIYREEQIQDFVSQIAQNFGSIWQTFSEVEQLQIMRCLIAFAKSKESSDRNTQVSDFSELVVSKCIEMCLNSLHLENPSEKEELSHLEKQAYDILASLPESPQILHILRSSLCGNLIETFISLPLSEISIEIFNILLINIPEMASRACDSIAQYYVDKINEVISTKNNFINVSKINDQFYRLISVLVSGLTTLLEHKEDISLDSLENMVTICSYNEPLLCESQLLLLETLLSTHPYFSPSVAMALTRIPLWLKNEIKLTSLSKLLRCLSTKYEIRKEIEYQYSDFVLLVLNLVSSYLREWRLESVRLYEEEERMFITTLQVFVQEYSQIIMENVEMLRILSLDIFDEIEKIVEFSLASSNSPLAPTNTVNVYIELFIQLLMTISHISIFHPVPSPEHSEKHILFRTLEIVRNYDIKMYVHFQTISMIPVLMIDQIWLNKDCETVIKEIVSFYEIFREINNSMDKEWQEIPDFEFWSEWPRNTGEFILGSLREARSRKIFQLYEHEMYLKMLSPFIMDEISK